jgi:GT2 family glycosyltransferase
MNVSIQLLCSDERHGWINPPLVCSLLDLLRQETCDLEFVCNYVPHGYARNVAAMNALRGGADWLLMIDNDQTLPGDFAQLIRDAHRTPEVNIVSCFTWSKSGNTRVFGIRNIDDAQQTNTFLEDMSFQELMASASVADREAPLLIFQTCPPADHHGFQEIEKGGTGVMLIKRPVLETIEQPWFYMPLDPSNGRPLEGEDGYFCVRAREFGFKVHTHSRYPCGHLKTVDLQKLFKPLSETLSS